MIKVWYHAIKRVENANDTEYYQWHSLPTESTSGGNDVNSSLSSTIGLLGNSYVLVFRCSNRFSLCVTVDSYVSNIMNSRDDLSKYSTVKCRFYVLQFFSSQQISSNGRHPLPLECQCVSRLSRPDQLTRLQTTNTWDGLQQTVFQSRSVCGISSCRDGDETCVISAACLSRKLR